MIKRRKIRKRNLERKKKIWFKLKKNYNIIY